jgi:hypothetical protein
MNKNDKELVFVSRHAPNDGQVALAQKMGYTGIKQISVVFNEDPVKDLHEAGITQKTIGIVAPSYITNHLLNEGYTLIEFVNSPVKREKMVFCCEGAYKYKLIVEFETIDEDDSLYNTAEEDLAHNTNIIPFIKQEFFPCPLSIEEQVESSLIPEEERQTDNNPFKTKGYISDGHANRYREYHKLLNPSDVISQKEEFNKNGKWSTTTITYFYSKPLYILTYYHSTHPGDGVFKIYKEENGEREEIYSLSTDDDYIDPKEFPPQFNQVEILEFMDEHIPNFRDTTSLIQRSLRLGTLPKSFKSKK